MSKMNNQLINIKLEIIKTEREGMIAENTFRTANGESIAYGEDAFDDLTKQLEELVEKWNDLVVSQRNQLMLIEL